MSCPLSSILHMIVHQQPEQSGLSSTSCSLLSSCTAVELLPKWSYGTGTCHFHLLLVPSYNVLVACSRNSCRLETKPVVTGNTRYLCELRPVQWIGSVMLCKRLTSWKKVCRNHHVWPAWTDSMAAKVSQSGPLTNGNRPRYHAKATEYYIRA